MRTEGQRPSFTIRAEPNIVLYPGDEIQVVDTLPFLSPDKWAFVHSFTLKGCLYALDAQPSPFELREDMKVGLGSQSWRFEVGNPGVG